MANFTREDVEAAQYFVELYYHRSRELELRTCTQKEAFLLGNDVLVILPTGYGKSLCYALLPPSCIVEQKCISFRQWYA